MGMFVKIFSQLGSSSGYMVSKLLGHENVRTTQKYYVDFLNDDYREPVEGLDLAYDIVEW